ncbi:MAG: NAD(P)H:quinone oxidoreductase [Armatimonadota bacterium]
MKILVVYYSTYGHTYQLAQGLVNGARSVDGAEVRLVRVPELVPEEIIQQNAGMLKGREMQQDVPLAQLNDLEWANGIAWGSPTRYGNMASQMKNYIDQAGPLWVKGALENKPATCFTSSNTLHGGQESTTITMMLPLIHLGMIILGVPYSVPGLTTTTRGGTPYGASTVAGANGENCPDETELAIAFAQGKRLAEITRKMICTSC